MRFGRFKRKMPSDETNLPELQPNKIFKDDSVHFTLFKNDPCCSSNDGIPPAGWNIWYLHMWERKKRKVMGTETMKTTCQNRKMTKVDQPTNVPVRHFTNFRDQEQLPPQSFDELSLLLHLHLLCSKLPLRLLLLLLGLPQSQLQHTDAAIHLALTWRTPGAGTRAIEWTPLALCMALWPPSTHLH